MTGTSGERGRCILGAEMHLAVPRLLALVASSLLLACGSSLPPPSEHLVSADASLRAVQRVGTDKGSKSAQRLAMAQAAIEQAKVAMGDGRNAEAQSLLTRSEAEADLANTLAKEEVLDAEVARLRAKVAQEEGKK